MDTPTQATQNYLEVSPEQGARFFGAPVDGAVVMLNLLRFRERTAYSHAPALKPASSCSGEDATPLISKVFSRCSTLLGEA